jgi:hypothetical protein
VESDWSDTMSLSELLDAATKIREAIPGAVEELRTSAAPALAAMGGKTKAEKGPRLWVRFDAHGIVANVAQGVKLEGEPGEGEKDVEYRPV